MYFHLTELIVKNECGEEVVVPCDFIFYSPIFNGDTGTDFFKLESKDAEALIRALAPFCDSIISITSSPIPKGTR